MKKPKIIQVVQLGQPILRAKAKPVRDVTAAEMQEIIENLLATCADFNGVGIAAPQIDESARIFIVASHPSPRYPKAPMMKPTPMINPKIVERSRTKKKDWEGCLSIPGLRGLVLRHTWVRVEYTDRKGKLHKAHYSDFPARIFQHELDHLNGIVFTDHAASADLVTEKEYARIMKATSKKK